MGGSGEEPSVSPDPSVLMYIKLICTSQRPGADFMCMCPETDDSGKLLCQGLCGGHLPQNGVVPAVQPGQPCGGERLLLMFDRWRKLGKAFYSEKRGEFDISKARICIAPSSFTMYTHLETSGCSGTQHKGKKQDPRSPRTCRCRTSTTAPSTTASTTGTWAWTSGTYIRCGDSSIPPLMQCFDSCVAEPRCIGKPLRLRH